MKDDCVHHWRIETPNGGSSVLGVCKRCNALKRFSVAGALAYDWVDEKALGRRKEQRQ